VERGVKLTATLEKIEAAIEKRAEALAEAAGDDLKRLEGEIEGLLDFGHKIQQHPAVTGETPAAPADPPAADPTPAAAGDAPAAPASGSSEEAAAGPNAPAAEPGSASSGS
jgi:hypothetical protein